jgi:glycosyltransferase involved in cell wall biosynthesis
MLDHAYLAKRFRQLAPLESPPDLVVCTIPTIELSDAAVQYARRNAIPAVVDVRDTWPDALVDAIPRWLRRAARLAAAPLAAQAARALRMASAITAVSPAYLDWALRRSGRGPSSWDRVFPHGYPRISYSTTELEAAAQRLRSLGVNGSKVIVWFVGMLGRTCDLSSVIRAARRLAPDHRSDIQFVISGTGDNEGRWRAEAADVRSVVFTGWVRGAEIAYLTSVARVGLAAYAAGAPQTYPNKFFEYMHAGLPIVSSLSGPAADLLDEHACGLTYRAGDDQDLAQVLRRLLSDDALRARIGANSRAAFDRLYAADIVYPDMAAYLESLSLSGAST